MIVKCFKISEVGLNSVSLTALKLVKESKVDVNSDITQVGTDDLIKELGLNECDCLYISTCNSNSCFEVFEYLNNVKRFQYLISHKPSRLLGLTILLKADEAKEVDTFFGSQLIVENVDIMEDTYVFEGDIAFRKSNNCLGIMVRTDSGIKFVLAGDDVSNRSTGSAKRSRKRKKRGSRRSKKRLKKKG